MFSGCPKGLKDSKDSKGLKDSKDSKGLKEFKEIREFRAVQLSQNSLFLNDNFEVERNAEITLPLWLRKCAFAVGISRLAKNEKPQFAYANEDFEVERNAEITLQNTFCYQFFSTNTSIA